MWDAAHLPEPTPSPTPEAHRSPITSGLADVSLLGSFGTRHLGWLESLAGGYHSSLVRDQAFRDLWASKRTADFGLISLNLQPASAEE